MQMVRKGCRGPSISAELRGSFEVVIMGRCHENEGQLHPYLGLGEDGNDTILDRVSVQSYTTMMFYKNTPLVNGLILDTAWSALLAHVSFVLIVNIINEENYFRVRLPDWVRGGLVGPGVCVHLDGAGAEP
jgi:hypothetical protein